MKASPLPNYSNYSTLQEQASRGCTDPSRETQLYELHTLGEMYQTNIFPRMKRDYQITNRYSMFPLESAMTNKSGNIHLGPDEVFYNLGATPCNCVANSCGETNIPVYLSDKLLN